MTSDEPVQSDLTVLPAGELESSGQSWQLVAFFRLEYVPDAQREHVAT